MDRALSIINSVGKAHNKVIAVTETGYEGIPDAKWWTGTLLPALEKYPLAYVLVWRNAREKATHYYAPIRDRHLRRILWSSITIPRRCLQLM